MAFLPAEHFTEPGSRGHRLSAQHEMGYIPQLQSPEAGDPLLAFLGHNFRHRCGRQRQTVPQKEGRDIPEMGKEYTGNGKMTEEGQCLCTLLLHPVNIPVTVP